jgi:hypothetical protein
MSPEQSRQRLSSTKPRSARARPWRKTACEPWREAGRPFRREGEARDRPLATVVRCNYLVARVLPWACLLGLSTTVAWAMTVGVTGGAHGADVLSSPQSGPLVEDATLVVDYAFAPPRFRAASKVLTITVEGPGGSYDLPCVTTTERTSFDTLTVPVDQLMDLFRELCSPEPGAS